MAKQFKNRTAAGKALARELEAYRDEPDVIVLGLPRGGIPVAYEVARALNAPLDVFLVRKLGVPGHDELAMGAIASGGVRVLSEEVKSMAGVSEEEIERVVQREREELEARARTYRGDRPDIDVEDKVVVLVDDGMATGSTMSAALRGLKTLNPRQIIVAVPAAAPSTCREFEDKVDELICLISPEPYLSVGTWYEEFGQTTNDEVRRLLREANPA